MKKLIVIFILFYSGITHAQFTDRVWCFGDSAGITFSSGQAIPSYSIVKSPGNCASISDSLGNLTLYCFSDVYGFGEVINSNHHLIYSGDTLIGSGGYQSLMILPFPGFLNRFVIFSLFGSAQPAYQGIYYSIADISLLGGQGAIISKNIQLTNLLPTDCITAVKHGNGRDWWIITQQRNPMDNHYLVFLLDTSGITPIPIQVIGPSYFGYPRLRFFNDGTHLIRTTQAGDIDQFDFDRCTGLLSNPQHIDQNVLSAMVGLAFSQSGRFLYVSNSDNWFSPFQVYQYDMQAANIAQSKTLVYADSTTSNGFSGGFMQRGPDGVIYIGSISYSFPYPDTLYDNVNQYLSVIRFPDTQGIGCSVQKCSFYLGGIGRSYWGLPNNPDYELGPLAGSPCDTLLAVQEPAETQSGELFVYYSPNWNTAFINAQKLKGREYTLRVVDVLGNEILLEKGEFSPPYFTKNLNCSSFAKGMYVVVLRTEGEYLSCKFLVQ